MDAATADTQPRRISGAEIRAKIEANRQKRLSIADAMKAEAGVSEHEVWHENRGGLAWIDTGKIQSPEGRKIAQLHIVAHECGHIFLHRRGTAGYRFAGHVKEWEAEAYAHQCFVEHGMRMPKRLSKWGRTYVGQWIAKDRAAGIPIDARVQAYVLGRRSPYEALRDAPATWQTFKSQQSPLTKHARRWLRSRHSPERRDHRIVHRVGGLAEYLWSWFCMGWTLSFLALMLGGAAFISPELAAVVKTSGPGWREMFVSTVGGLLIANAAMIVRTLRF
ncbi:MAG: ImmA/IrrE family metallo-endopeptidase [Hyphomicrobiaceae bacterium]